MNEAHNVHSCAQAFPDCEPTAHLPSADGSGNRRLDMKRILFAAVATLAMTAPLAAPAFADQGRGSYDRHDDRRDNRTVVVVKHDNKPYRDSRSNGRWDNNRYNGYYVKNV